MFYSLLTLNARSCRVQREVNAPYELHRTLLAAFPAETIHAPRTGDGAGLLYRLEPWGAGWRILVQSHGAPDWSHLPAGYLAEPAQTKECTPEFAAGQRLAFRLRANPTKRLSAGKNGDLLGRRTGLYAEDEQLAWLARKAGQHGFTVLGVQVSPSVTVEQEKAIARGDGVHRLEFLSVQYDGVLEVADAAAFERAVAGGIGSAKGFGFGLLSLARWRET
jgi:CRISPR system Cascade subunit CasE